MSKLVWDQNGQRLYETGVDHGVLYLTDPETTPDKEFDSGFAWNGLVSVSESPSGAEANKQYADNRVYLNLVSNEEFGGTIEAFTYPEEFEACDGTRPLAKGVSVTQQTRQNFGLSYRTLIGNDLVGTDYGYKLHLVYNGLAAPSEKSRSTVNESPEAVTFSWELSTTAVDVPGLRPSAHIVINSTLVDQVALKVLEDILYGTTTVAPRLPFPAELIEIFGEDVTVALQPDGDGS